MTQVGPRPVKAGLRDHEEGVSGVDGGVENTSLPLRKRGRMTTSVCATFSDFIVVENQNDSDNHNRKKRRRCPGYDHLETSSFLINQAEQLKN